MYLPLRLWKKKKKLPGPQKSTCVHCQKSLHRGNRHSYKQPYNPLVLDFPDGSEVKNPPATQGTQVQSPIGEDSTCLRATKPLYHSYWICTLEPASHNYWGHTMQLLKPACSRACALQQEKPPQWEAYTLQLESSPCSLQLEKSPCTATKTQCSQK